jgi:pyruvate formate lyase activating enzyme
MQIGGLQKSTLIDYPGHIACTVFLIGCNFRCPWCYSSELVIPDKITRQPIISEKEFFLFLEQRRGFLDGVVVCGGEPTINEDLLDFILKIKKNGFKVKLDTNGSNPEMIKKIINDNLIDYVAMDIKAPIHDKDYDLKNNKYKRAVGVEVDLKKIKKSVEIIKNSKIDYEFRTTVVPDIHTKQDIIEIAKNISPAKRYFLQNFRAEKNINSIFKDKKSFDVIFLEEIIKEISYLFQECKFR